jgi:hypothetical protein
LRSQLTLILIVIDYKNFHFSLSCKKNFLLRKCDLSHYEMGHSLVPVAG